MKRLCCSVSTTCMHPLKPCLNHSCSQIDIFEEHFVANYNYSKESKVLSWLFQWIIPNWLWSYDHLFMTMDISNARLKNCCCTFSARKRQRAVLTKRGSIFLYQITFLSKQRQLFGIRDRHQSSARHFFFGEAGFRDLCWIRLLMNGWSHSVVAAKHAKKGKAE